MLKLSKKTLPRSKSFPSVSYHLPLFLYLTYEKRLLLIHPNTFGRKFRKKMLLRICVLNYILRASLVIKKKIFTKSVCLCVMNFYNRPKCIPLMIRDEKLRRKSCTILCLQYTNLISWIWH